MRWSKCIVISLLLLQQSICSAFAPDSTFEKGNIALEEGKYLVAKDYYSSFLEKTPSHQAAKYNLALCHFHLGENAFCLSLLSEIPNWKKQPENLSLASWCAYKQGNTDSAKSWLDKVSDEEKNAEMLLLKAILQGDVEAKFQLKLLDEALMLNPGMLEILYYRAKCHMLLQDTAAAIQDLNVLLTHRENAEAYGLRACIAKSHKDYSLAVKDYNNAFKTDSSIQWKYKLIEAFSQSGDYAKAYKTTQFIKNNFPSEEEKIQPIYNKLKLYHWLNTYWIYISVGFLLLLALLYLLFFK